MAVRVVEVILASLMLALELPNKKRQTVYLREVLDCDKFRDNPSPLTVVLGKDIAGEPVVADLAKCRTCWWPVLPVPVSRSASTP